MTKPRILWRIFVIVAAMAIAVMTFVPVGQAYPATAPQAQIDHPFWVRCDSWHTTKEFTCRWPANQLPGDRFDYDVQLYSLDQEEFLFRRDVGLQTSITFCADPGAASNCQLIHFDDNRFPEGKYRIDVNGGSLEWVNSPPIPRHSRIHLLDASDWIVIDIDTTGPQAGQVQSGSGSVTSDNRKLTFDLDVRSFFHGNLRYALFERRGGPKFDRYPQIRQC